MGMLPHSTEIVAYHERSAFLVRCHGCGARVWGESEEEAKALQTAHAVQAREGNAEPERRVVVAMRRDTGRTEYREFNGTGAMRNATSFMSHAMTSPHWWGWTFALLAGNATPHHIINGLAAGSTEPVPALGAGPRAGQREIEG